MAQRCILAISLMLFVLISRHCLKASVIVKLDSKPALLGQNVTLTCYTQQPLKNSKECPVRQWTIGDNTAVLVYNSFSYNTTKYADNTNLSSDHFSIIIKHFSFSDVNKKYTCSCGFYSASMFLSLDGYPIIHKPDKSSDFYIQNDTVISKLNLQNAFPLPHCLLVMKDQQVTNNVSSTKAMKGLLYDVSVDFVYYLTMTDCNQILHLTVECYFTNSYTLQFNGTVNYKCGDITDAENIPVGKFNTSTAKMDVKRQLPMSTAAVGASVGILSFIAVGVVALVLIYFKKKETSHNLTAQNRLRRADIVEKGNGTNLLHYPAQNPTSSSPLACRGFDERKG